MTPIPATVECVWEARALLGEGPCWDPRTDRIYWVDIKSSRLLAWSDAERRFYSWDLPFRLMSIGVPPDLWAACRRLDRDDLIGCGDIGLAVLSIEDGAISATPIVHPEADRPQNRFNDGKFGPDGRYWAGTMHDPEIETSGSLYGFHAEGTWSRLDDSYKVPNGPAFSPDGRTVYHTDSGIGTIYAFQLSESGNLIDKRIFAQYGEGEGSPDGMTTDRHGNLWVAFWDGWRIEKISPSGERLGVIAMRTARVTSCVFADAACQTLYVTSACIGLDSTDRLAGSLFKVRLS